MIAEGGTERGHGVSIARGPSPDGPVRGRAAQPGLLAPQHEPPGPERRPRRPRPHATTAGGWSCSARGRRGMTQAFAPMGRETFATRVEWVGRLAGGRAVRALARGSGRRGRHDLRAPARDRVAERPRRAAASGHATRTARSVLDGRTRRCGALADAATLSRSRWTRLGRASSGVGSSTSRRAWPPSWPGRRRSAASRSATTRPTTTTSRSAAASSVPASGSTSSSTPGRCRPRPAIVELWIETAAPVVEVSASSGVTCDIVRLGFGDGRRPGRRRGDGRPVPHLGHDRVVHRPRDRHVRGGRRGRVPAVHLPGPRWLSCPAGILVGAAYYPEYTPSRAARDRPRPDGRGRVHASSASASRPGPPGSRADGTFDLEWMAPVLDAAERPRASA